MDVLQAIHTKRAVRKFLPKQLKDDEIRAILNAGRRAQSSKNSQPWRFIAVQEHATLEALSQCGDWAGHIAGAALAVAILTPEPLAKFQTMFDAGQAAAYMQLAAWALGIGSCPASIYQPDKARAILGFPDEWHVRIVLSFGYPANPDVLTRPNRSGGRQHLEKIVHWETW